MKRYWAVPLSLLLLCATLPAVTSAQTFGGEVDTSYVVYTVAGETAPDGKLALSIIPGRYANRSIKVVSQPSDTILAIVVDSEYMRSEEWSHSEHLKVGQKEPQATASTSLPLGSPRFVIEGRPSTDDRIQVWVNSSAWPDGTTGERLLADGRVGPGHDFGFSTLLKPGPKSPSIEHCCSGGPCGTMCKNCSGTKFECCLGPDCCLIVCEWEANCLTCE
jgi:hypothetical protein